LSSKVILFTYVVSDMTCSALHFFEEQSTYICLVYDLDTIQLGMLEASVHTISCLNRYNPIHGLSPRRLLSPHAPGRRIVSSLEILVEIAQVIVQSADLTIKVPHPALRQPLAADFAFIGILLLRMHKCVAPTAF